MKQSLLATLCGVALVLLSSSCDGFLNHEDDIIWDFSPVEICFEVVDAKGNDMLANGDIDISKVTIVTRGMEVGVYTEEEMETWTWKDGMKPAPTRAYMPRKYGAALRKSAKTGQYFISVGEYDGANSTDMEKMMVIWPNGSKDEIAYSRKVVIRGRDVEAIMHWFLNGKEVQNEGIITLVK